MDDKVTVGYDVSRDGSVIVGLAYLKPNRVEAFRYDAKSGTTTPLGTLTGGRSRGSVVSGDGRVVTGWDDLTGTGTGRGFRYGTIWWEGMQRLFATLQRYRASGGVERCRLDPRRERSSVGVDSRLSVYLLGWPC